MTFNPEQLRIIEAARPIWEGYLKSHTINTGQREIADLRALYADTFGMDGKNPEWSSGCVDCVTNCMRRIFDAVDRNLSMGKASIASDVQPAKAKKASRAKKK